MHTIRLKRVYDRVEAKDGIRLLADRLWPRGIKKADLDYEIWIKELCPSTMLRRAWHSQQIDYATFKQAYAQELQQQPAGLEEMATLLMESDITLLTATKEPERSHLPVLRDCIAVYAK